MPDFVYYLLKYSFYVLTVYFYLMVVTIILSWTPLRETRFYGILDKVTSPYLNVFRGWFVLGRIDITPMVGLFLFQFILQMVSRAL